MFAEEATHVDQSTSKENVYCLLMFSVSCKQPLFEINHDTSILIIFFDILIYRNQWLMTNSR